uniref:hypothetical protein n=2 Tax=Agrobacterium tumefaciens TaxID=358 RepID=UPI00155D8C87|nr:hypothetical protein [Agrobacterium tumefaciens]
MTHSCRTAVNKTGTDQRYSARQQYETSWNSSCLRYGAGKMPVGSSPPCSPTGTLINRKLDKVCDENRFPLETNQDGTRLADLCCEQPLG